MWVNWKRFTFGALLLASLSLLLFGCGDHSGSQTAQKAISGVVSDPVTGLALPDATVTAYAIDANGVQATVPLSTPATVQSNNKGRYRLFIPAGYNGSVMVVASKSSSLGKLAKLLSLPASDVLIKAAVPQTLINRVSVPPVMVSFATNMVVQYLASTNANVLTSDNIRKANIVLETFFGPNFSQVPPPASVSDSATSKAQQDLMVSIQAVNSVTQGSDAAVTAIVVALSANTGLGTKADDIKAAISATVIALTAQGILPPEYVPSPAINTAISNAQSAAVAAPSLSDSTAPAPPTDLVLVAAAPKSVSLAWTASADADLAGYLIYRADASGVFVLAGGAPAGASGYVDATVAAGSSYNYQVAAFDASRNISVMSNQLAASTPAATDNVAPSVPAGLIAKGFDDVQVRLEWLTSQKTLDDGSSIPAVRYNVYRDFQLVGSSTGTSFSDLGLTPGTSYLYFVKSVDANGNLSAASASVSVRTLPATGVPAPQPPTALALDAGGSYFSNPLVWTASTSATTQTVTYNVYRDAVLIASGLTGTSYHDNAVSPSSAYLYLVTAVANHAESAGASLSVNTPANPNLTDVDPPSVPTNLVVVSASSNAVALSWAPSNKLTGDQVVSGYDVLRSTGGSGSFVKVASVSRPTFVDTNSLSPSTTYSYAVKAFGSAGVRSAASLSATVTTPAPIDLADSTAPSAPGNLVASGETGQLVLLTWSASTKSNADATHFVAGYRVFRDGAQIADVHNVVTFSDLAVAPLTSYRYSVVAYDNSGNLSDASEVTVTTGAAAANLHLISGRVSVNGVGIAGITVSNGTTQAITDVNGNYTILGVAGGSYTVAPVANTATTFLAFTPVSRSVTITSANVLGQDFAATITGSVTGGVIFPDGAVVGGVVYPDGTIIGSVLYPTGAVGVTVTYGNGGLSGAVVYYFPISGTITDNASAALPGAVVTLVNNSNNQVTSYQATSDSLGHYVIHAPAGTYKVRATLASFTFADSAPVTVSNTVQSQTVTVAAN
jgi:fibronectin type 3 domain-containing protein